MGELQDEYSTLRRTGYAGEGFYTPGQTLGGNASAGNSRNVPPHVARLKALEAAQKRKQVTQVLGGGNRSLGGPSSTRNLSPGELAARVSTTSA